MIKCINRKKIVLKMCRKVQKSVRIKIKKAKTKKKYKKKPKQRTKKFRK